MTKIKICGLFRSEDADYVNEALPDYIGFVFAESKRRVTASKADAIKHRLDMRIKTVGVFVDAAVNDAAALAQSGIIDIIQLHGSEDAAYIERLREKTDAKVIKAVRVKSARQVLAAQSLPCDYLLLDAYHPQKQGGSGKSFDWSMLPQTDKPYFLAGGINPQNLSEALKRSPYAIDLSSGAETNGVKDKDKIIKLVSMVRSMGI